MTNNSPMPDALTVTFPRLLSEIPEAQRIYRLITFDAMPGANEITTQFIIDGEVSAESDEPITEIIKIEQDDEQDEPRSPWVSAKKVQELWNELDDEIVEEQDNTGAPQSPPVVHLMDDDLLDTCGTADRDINLHVTPVAGDVTCEPCQRLIDEQVDLALDEPIPGDETITQFIDVPPSIALLLPSEAPRFHRGRRRAQSEFPYAMALLALAGIACLAYGVVVQVSQLAVTEPLLAAVSLPALVFSGVCLTLAILQKR